MGEVSCLEKGVQLHAPNVLFGTRKGERSDWVVYRNSVPLVRVSRLVWRGLRQ